MDIPRFDRVLRTGAKSLSAGSTAVSSKTSQAVQRAGPVFRSLAHAVQEHGPPALRETRRVLTRLARQGQAVADDALRRATEQRKSRSSRAAATRASRVARRAWLAQLEEYGRAEVEDLLERTSSPHAGPLDVVRFVDAGITQGKTRYPTRQFVLDWLEDDDTPPDLGMWRVSVIVVMGFAVLSVGMLAILS